MERYTGYFSDMILSFSTTETVKEEQRNTNIIIIIKIDRSKNVLRKPSVILRMVS